MKKKQVKSLTDTALEFFCELVVFIFTLTVELLTWVARKFWKRYFGIETPTVQDMVETPFSTESKTYLHRAS